MKGRSEKLYDPCSLDVHFCHAKFLCDKHFPIVLKVQIPPSRHYGVLFTGQSHLCFPSMSIKTMRHYLSFVVHFKFSDLSECCKKFTCSVNSSYFQRYLLRSFSLSKFQFILFFLTKLHARFTNTDSCSRIMPPIRRGRRSSAHNADAAILHNSSVQQLRNLCRQRNIASFGQQDHSFEPA